jgi:hypothetical protein
MSPEGNCWEWLPLEVYYPAERFFRSLKHEHLHYEKIRTIASAKPSFIYVWPLTMENVHTQTRLSIAFGI